MTGTSWITAYPEVGLGPLFAVNTGQDRAVGTISAVGREFPGLDTVIRDYAEGADILIHDGQYTPEEYEKKKDWGHSTWLEATHVARDARVKRLILFHHDPSHTDEMMMKLIEQARLQFENTDAAVEGRTICL